MPAAAKKRESQEQCQWRRAICGLLPCSCRHLGVKFKVRGFEPRVEGVHDQQRREISRTVNEEFWQPVKVKPPDGIRTKFADDDCPGLAMRQQLRPRNFSAGFRRV